MQKSTKPIFEEAARHMPGKGTQAFVLVILFAGVSIGWSLCAIVAVHADLISNIGFAMCLWSTFALLVCLRFALWQRRSSRVLRNNVGIVAERSWDEACSAVSRLHMLTERECDVLKYLSRGRNTAWISSKLGISPHTVKSHTYSIYQKTGAHSQQNIIDIVEDVAEAA